MNHTEAFERSKTEKELEERERTSTSSGSTLFENGSRQAKNLYGYSDEFKSRTSLGTYATCTSSSTVIGVGMISGRAIKRVGDAVIQLVEERIVRKSLRILQKKLSEKERMMLFMNPIGLETALAELLELTKPSDSTWLTRDGYPDRIMHPALNLVEESKKWLLEPQQLPVGSRMILIKYYARLYRISSNPDDSCSLLDRLFELSNHFNLSHRRNELEEIVSSHLVPVLCDFMKTYPERLFDKMRLKRFGQQFIIWSFLVDDMVSLDLEQHFIELCITSIIFKIPITQNQAAGLSFEVTRQYIQENFSVFRAFAPLALSDFNLIHLLAPLVSIRNCCVKENTEHLEMLSSSNDGKLISLEAHKLLDTRKSCSIVEYVLELYKDSLKINAIQKHIDYHEQVIQTLLFLCDLGSAKQQMLTLNANILLRDSIVTYEEEQFMIENRHIGVLSIVEFLEKLDSTVDWEKIGNCWLVKGCSMLKAEKLENISFSFKLFWWALHVFYEASKERPWLWSIMDDLKAFSRLATYLDLPILSWGLNHSVVSHVYTAQVAGVLEYRAWNHRDDENDIKMELQERTQEYVTFSDYLLSMQHRKKRFR